MATAGRRGGAAVNFTYGVARRRCPSGRWSAGGAATLVGIRTVLLVLSVALALRSFDFRIHTSILLPANTVDEETLVRASSRR